MPKFMLRAKYSLDGMKLLKEQLASGREKAFAAAAKKLGGKLDLLIYALGEDDVFGIVDMPDAGKAASLALSVLGSGAFATGSTTALLTVAEMDEVIKGTIAYSPPKH